MTTRMIGWLCLLMASLAAPRGTAAHVVLDQALEDPNGPRYTRSAGGADAYFVGQIFTADKSGVLAGVQMEIQSDPKTANLLEVRLVKLAEGSLVPTQVGRVLVKPYELPAFGRARDFFFVDFTTANIAVQPWDRFAFLARSLTPIGQAGSDSDFYLTTGCDTIEPSCTAGYDFGERVRATSKATSINPEGSPDFLFRTFVRTPTGSPQAPRLFQRPFDRKLWLGQRLFLSTFATGTEPFQYQWFKDQQPIPNATSSKFDKPSVTLDDAGSYTVEVRNSADSVISETGNVRVFDGPFFPPEYQPGSRVWAAPGSVAGFYASAEGKGSLRYQWMKGTAPIQGATSAYFQIDSVRFEDAGEYYAIVTDDLRSGESPRQQLIVRDDSGRVAWTARAPSGLVVTPDNDTGLIFGASWNQPSSVFEGSTGEIQSGRAQWTSTVASLPILGDRIFITGSSILTLRNKYSGLIEKSTTLYPSVGGQTTPHLHEAAALTEDGLLFSSVYSRGVVGIDWSSGTKLWTFPTQQLWNSGVVYQPATALLYFASATSFYCLRRDGSLHWRYDVPQDPDGWWHSNISPSLGVGNLVYFARGNRLFALDGATGEQRWSHTLSNLSGGPGGAVDEHGRLFWRSQGELVALDGTTGNFLWKTSGTADYPAITSQPIVLDDGSLLVGAENVLVCLNRADGALRWTFVAESYLAGWPTLSPQGHILLNTWDRLYALKDRASIGRSPWPKPLGNLSNTGTPNVPPASDIDLVLETVQPPVAPRMGEEIVFSLNVSLAEGAGADQVVLTSKLLTGLEWISSESSRGTVARNGQTVTFSIGSLLPGEQAAATVRARVVGPLLVRHEAEVTASVPDLRPFDNSVSHQFLPDGPGGADVSRRSLPVKDLAFNPATGRLYLSTDSPDESLRNRILVLNPQNGRFENPLLLSSPAAKLASKGSRIYAQRANAEAYADSFDLASHALHSTVGSGSNRTIHDMAVPSDSAMVILATDIDIQVFRNNQLLHSVPAYPSMIEVSGDEMALYQLAPSKCRLFRYDLNRGRLTLGPSYKSVPCGFDDFQFGNGKLFHFSGSVYDGALNLVGRATGLGENPKLLVDGAANTLFALSKHGSAPGVWRLSIRDATTLLERRAIDLPALTGLPIRLVRYGTTGVACLTSTGELVVIVTDPLPQVSISDARYAEGYPRTKRVYVSLSQPSAVPVSVKVAFVDGSAKAGSDYTPTSTYVPFEPGRTSRALLVSLVDDAIAEPTESYTLVLSDPVGAVLAKDAGVVTIDDDDAGAAGLAASSAAWPPTLQIAGLWTDASHLHLQFDAEPGESYRLRSSPTVEGPRWTDTGAPLEADGPEAVFDIPRTEGPRSLFFRIVREAASTR